MEAINQTVDALTSMIEVNDKRRKVYQSLAQEMQQSELRSLIRYYAEQSKEFSNELTSLRSAYGGFGMPRKKGTGVWLQAASFMDHWFSKKEVSKFEETELEALKVYKTVMQDYSLPAAAARDIQRQSHEFDKALTRMRALLDEGANEGNADVELAQKHAY